MSLRQPFLPFALVAIACSSPAASEPDASSAPDAEAPADAALPDAAPPPDADTRRRLSETGLYADIEEKIVQPDALEFEPAYELWSDGADKTRWLLLPDGEVIDTGEMDHWRFPVGTRVFKEFRVGEILVETRLIEKTGADEYWMGAFVWREDESDAVFAEFGERDALGTGHDVPNPFQCLDCHEGEPGRILGLSAIQMSHDGEPNLTSLADGGLLSDPPEGGGMHEAPGDGVVSEALGYLHANCGNCHNPLGPAWLDGEMDLRLDVDELEPEETAIYETTIDVELERFSQPGYEVRVASGDPEASALYYRMSVTSEAGRDRMPPLATDEVDEDALDIIGAWIESLDDG